MAGEGKQFTIQNRGPAHVDTLSLQSALTWPRDISSEAQIDSKVSPDVYPLMSSYTTTDGKGFRYCKVTAPTFEVAAGKLKDPQSCKNEQKELPSFSISNRGSFHLGWPPDIAKLEAETGIKAATPYELFEKLYAEGTPAKEEDMLRTYYGYMTQSWEKDRILRALLVGEPYYFMDNPQMYVKLRYISFVAEIPIEEIQYEDRFFVVKCSPKETVGKSWHRDVTTITSLRAAHGYLVQKNQGYSYGQDPNANGAVYAIYGSVK